MYIDGNKIKRWYFNHQLHRIDGPAVEYPDGAEFWFLNDKIHRCNGPALEYPDGKKEWYLNGRWYCTKYSDKDMSPNDILGFIAWLDEVVKLMP